MRGRYEGIHGSALVGMFYCCTGSDGTIRGCPDQAERYDDECLGSRSFEEIWGGGLGDIRGRGWFVRMGGVWCMMIGAVVPGDAV